MAGVKEIGAAPTPTPTKNQTPSAPPMSASDAAAAGRAARKSAELEAGQVMVAQAARQAAEAKENLEKERAEQENEIGRAHV